MSKTRTSPKRKSTNTHEAAVKETPAPALIIERDEIENWYDLEDGRALIVTRDPSRSPPTIESKKLELQVINELLGSTSTPHPMLNRSIEFSPALPPTAGLLARTNAAEAANLVKQILHLKTLLTESRLTLISTDPRDPDLNQYVENVAANYDHLANLIEQLNTLTP